VPARTGLRLLGVVVMGMVACLVLSGQATASGRAQEKGEFEITGEVGGLYPGAEVTLQTRVTNPYPFPIRVTSVAATVGDAGPGCPGSMLEVEGSEMAVEIPAGETRSVPLDIRMDRTAPDACQGATWPLQFRGTATDAEPAAGESPFRPPGRGGFAYTGANLLLLLLITLSLAAAGVLALRQARRRHPKAASP
jgi:hypothetical protein